MLRNIVGKPVIGGDFFGRTREVGQVCEILQTDNVLLLAPRRVGKTSLMYWLRDHPPDKNWSVIYESVADVNTEMAFVSRLYHATRKHKAAARALRTLRKGPLGKWFQRLEEVSVPGLSIKFSDARPVEWTQLADELLRILNTLDGAWLFAIDELPVFVLELIRQDDSCERARMFLNWFRKCRIDADSHSLHWLLAGSIGLDTVARRHQLGDTINDLRIYDDFGPFSASMAFDFLDALADSYAMPLSDAVKARICAHISWLIPYHLHLYFSELRNQRDAGDSRPIDATDVEAIRDRLLSPSKRAYFDYWRQRLHIELGAIDSAQAIEILDRVAEDPDGARAQTLSAALHTAIPEAGERQRQLHYLLDVLLNDGYLAYQNQRYRFRSTLLRDYWRLRSVP